MKAYQSSARLTFGKFVKVGMFLGVSVVLGVGLAVIAGLFVLGDLSGTLQPERAASSRQAKGLIPMRYVAANPSRGGFKPAKPDAAADQAVPDALVATPLDDSSTVAVARATPVLANDVPVRRAQPVLLTAVPAFDARAALADDDSVPQARAGSAGELVRTPERTYKLPSGGNLAQRDGVALNW